MAGITGTELARRRRPCRHPCGSTTPGINVGNGQALDKAGWRGAPGWFDAVIPQPRSDSSMSEQTETIFGVLGINGAAGWSVLQWLQHTDKARHEDLKDAIEKQFTAAVRRAGIAHCTPHDLRRTCGSWLVQARTPIQEVARLLRHSDIQVTMSVYAHLMPDQLQQTVAVLDRHNLVIPQESRSMKTNVSD